MDPRDVVTVPDAAADTDEMPLRLGHFTLGRRLGAGGMGVVFEGRDTVLDRAVAVKLLHPGAAGAVGRARLLREAKALARLSHPNVVPVYEVGHVDEDLFVAMELVDGATLAEWLKTPRDWRAVTDLFIAAGRGLAAVHALELVHRDFKPSNVLIDRGGTPKVGDFGLVCHLDEGDMGPNVGTPAYMAPEQRRGEPVDARADQFAFATSFAEALGADSPSRLRSILARAGAQDRALRFPSMTALLHELVRVRRGRLRWWLGGAVAVLALTAALIAWQIGRAQAVPPAAVDPCPVPDVASIWGDARRDQLRAHLLDIDPAQGAARLDAVDRSVTSWIAGWRTMHVEACRATRVDGRQSDTLLDHRMSCLDRALAELGDTVDAVAGAPDRSGVDGAMHAVVELPGIEDCADADALTERVPPPTDPAARAEYDAIVRELAAIDVRGRVDGKVAGLEPRAVAAVARARALGHPETLGAALLTQARAQGAQEEIDGALTSLREAIEAGASARDDQMAADAWLAEIGVVNDLQGRPADAQLLVATASAAVTRAGGRPQQRFELLLLEARIGITGGDFTAARSFLDQAKAVLDGATVDMGDRRDELQLAAANVEGQAANWTAAVAGYRAHLASIRAALGPDHPDMINASFNLGISLHRLGQDNQALDAFRDAARIGEARLPPSPKLASLITGVGSALESLGRNQEALPYLQRALEMGRATMPPGDPRLANTDADLGAALRDLDRSSEARPYVLEAIALYQKVGKPSANWAGQLYNLGALEVSFHDCAAAAAPLASSLAMYEQVEGANGSDLGAPLDSQAECAAAAHRWNDVFTATKRMAALPGEGDFWHVDAHFLHGRALVESRRDVASGMREARAARAAMPTSGGTADDLAEVDRWFAAHH